MWMRDNALNGRLDGLFPGQNRTISVCVLLVFFASLLSFLLFFSKPNDLNICHTALACLFEHWCVPYVAFKLTTRFPFNQRYISRVNTRMHRYILTLTTTQHNSNKKTRNNDWIDDGMKNGRGRDCEWIRHKYTRRCRRSGRREKLNEIKLTECVSIFLLGVCTA